jgi:hypothetical protein
MLGEQPGEAVSDKPPVSPENVPTLAAVALILGLLSLGVGLWVRHQVNIAAVGLSSLDVVQAQRSKELEKQVKDLTDRVTKLEAAAATTAAASTPPAAPTDATAGAGAGAAVPATKK